MISPPYEPIVGLKGLTTAEAEASRNRNGTNTLPAQENRWRLLIDIITEPMFGLLAGACAIYVFLGEWQEGIVQR